MRVADVMTKNPLFCTPEDGIEAVARLMCEADCGQIPVLECRLTRKPVGVITDRDITCRVVARGRNPCEIQVSDVMSAPVVTATPDMDVDACCELLETRRLRRLPVVDAEGRCCGIVSQADIALKCGREKAGELVSLVSRSAV